MAVELADGAQDRDAGGGGAEPVMAQPLGDLVRGRLHGANGTCADIPDLNALASAPCADAPIAARTRVRSRWRARANPRPRLERGARAASPRARPGSPVLVTGTAEAPAATPALERLRDELTALQLTLETPG